jgi:hypothetical protein
VWYGPKIRSSRIAFEKLSRNCDNSASFAVQCGIGPVKLRLGRIAAAQHPPVRQPAG